MRGAVITSVKGFGTEEGDDWAYLVCTLQPGEDHILAFDESVADRLCAAVLQATAHVQRKEMERRELPHPGLRWQSTSRRECLRVHS